MENMFNFSSTIFFICSNGDLIEEDEDEGRREEVEVDEKLGKFVFVEVIDGVNA